ncbi:hypothetical protein [Flavobacterium facile]|uniref:hypothetical protein n=2 Tax=Pseudomonadati TaxID=3379134 RepID=UPI002E75E7A1|nr:hypothetical protein [Flavobacterium sp. T-12]
MGILLYIIATILWIILTPINWVIVSFKHGLSNSYFKETAIDIDKFGNRNFRTFLNATMVKVKKEYWSYDRIIEIEPYKFGNVNETISSALGKNQRNNTLSRLGKIIVFILDKFDKEHCKNSIVEI